MFLLFAVGCSAPATPTPIPTATPTPTVPPSQTPEVEPHVEIRASTTTLRVGETVTITGEPVDLGLPHGYPGPATWAGGASKAIALTVKE